MDLIYRETHLSRRPDHQNQHPGDQAEHDEKEVDLKEYTTANGEQTQLTPGTSAHTTKPDPMVQHPRDFPGQTIERSPHRMSLTATEDPHHPTLSQMTRIATDGDPNVPAMMMNIVAIQLMREKPPISVTR